MQNEILEIFTRAISRSIKQENSKFFAPKSAGGQNTLRPPLQKVGGLVPLSTL